MSAVTFDLEKQIRDKWQQPMLDMIKKAGATYTVHPEGRCVEQFTQGDLKYTLDNREFRVDIKGEKEIYNSRGPFYETWSNIEESPGRPLNFGWGRKKNYDKVWYVFMPLDVLVILNMEAWHIQAEAALSRGKFKENKQGKHSQDNVTMGFGCPLKWMLDLDEGRTGDACIIAGVFFLKEGKVVSVPKEKAILRIVEIMDNLLSEKQNRSGK